MPGGCAQRDVGHQNTPPMRLCRPEATAPGWVEIEADQSEAKAHGWRLPAIRWNRYGRLVKSRER
jgi:hypothetical protein